MKCKTSALCFKTFIDYSHVYLSWLLYYTQLPEIYRSSSDTRISVLLLFVCLFACFVLWLLLLLFFFFCFFFFNICFVYKNRNIWSEILFFFTGTVQWNSLPFVIRHSDSAPVFRPAVKTYLFQPACSVWFCPLCRANLLRFVRIL